MHLALALVLLAGPEAAPAAAPKPDRPVVVMETTHGTIKVELDAKRAPITVENFLGYVKSGHYNGTIFHRVIKDFMIQGGGFNPSMNELPTGKPIKNEHSNGLQNRRGTIAMARTSDPHSATAQFFINLKDNDFLDKEPGYAVFGRVIDGQGVVDKIGSVATTRKPPFSDVPVEAVVIKKVTLEGAAAPAKSDAPKAEAPKADAPKSEAPKSDAPAKEEKSEKQ
jgi:peptidyl-prolyl cis-trans isomerase B (cyclophilin B)